MKEVGTYTLKPNTEVGFSTKKPGEDVVTYVAKLLKKTEGGTTSVKEWKASDLESGVKFTFDAKKNERYEIRLAATVLKAAEIDAEVSFSIHPPADDPESVDLDQNEGLVERV